LVGHSHLLGARRVGLGGGLCAGGRCQHCGLAPRFEAGGTCGLEGVPSAGLARRVGAVERRVGTDPLL
jgi:hypothetical protein